MAQPYPVDNVQAHIQGEISGQIAVGNGIMQVGSVHGNVFNLASLGEFPRPHARPTPIDLRPPRFPGLLDRETECNIATATLKSSMPLEFHGEGGIGKTSLLCHLAYQLPEDSLPDGILYLPARGQPVPDLLQSFYDAFYECELPFKPTNVQIRLAMQDKRALILLDDVELAREGLDALIGAAPKCVFLLASPQRRLWGKGQALDLQGLPLEDALALMEQELGRSLTPKERSAAESLCTALEGHPLRILQAVSTAKKKGQSLSEIAGQMQSAPSERALTTLILESLSEPAQRVLAALAAVRGASLSAEHLAALTGLSDLSHVLEPLLQCNLIQSHSPRYSLTGTLAQDLQQTLDLSTWTERALAYFTNWTTRHRSATGRLLEEADAILQTLQWAVEAGRWREVLRLGRAVEGALALGRRWGAWARVMQWLLQAGRALGDRAIQAWALHQSGTRALCLGEDATARTLLIRALRLRESLGDQIGAAVTRHNLNILIGPPPPPRRPPQAPRTPMPSDAAVTVTPLVTKEIVALVAVLLLAAGGLVGIWGISKWIVAPTPTQAAIASVVRSATPTLSSTSVPTAIVTGTPTATHTPTHTPTFTAATTLTLLPTSTPCVPQPPAGWIRCTVVRGDTLYSLARRCGTTVQTVMQVNCLTGSKIVSGQRLWLPCCATPTPVFTKTWTPTPTSSSTPTPIPTNDLTPPPTPVLLNPTGDVRVPCPVDPANVSFQWTSVTDPSGIQNYEVHLEAIEVKQYVYPPQFSTVPALELSIPCFEWYSWQVRATDGEGNIGAWSEESRFFVARFITTPTPIPLPVPTPLEPGYRDTYENAGYRCPTLRWQPFDDPDVVYDVTLEYDLSTNEWVEVHTWYSRSGFELEVPSEDPFCLYYTPYRWRVRASDGIGNTSEWSHWLYYGLVEG